MQALRLIEPDHRPKLALELPPGTSFDEWVSIGRKLCLTSQTLNWHIGDWWAFGDHRYGERAKAAAEGIFGREFQSLADMGWVSRAFPEPSERSEAVSWSCYRVVASLADGQKDIALSLIEKAERQSLSVRELRREVNELKSANDPERTGATVPSKSIPPQSQRTETTKYAEIALEFAEALQQLRTLTRHENDILSEVLTYLEEAHAGHRPCPEDFDVIFVEQGRVACESWYRASRLTVNRWLIERGKTRLINERAEFVRHERDQRHPDKRRDPDVHLEIDEALHDVAREAASFLRINRYGGWTITTTIDGAWLVGTVRKSSDELIAMAERQGFDSEAYRREMEAE